MKVSARFATMFALLLNVFIIGCGSGVRSQSADGTGGGSSTATDLSLVGKTAAGASLVCASTTSGTPKNAYQTYGLPAFAAVTNTIISNVGAELGANGTTNLGTSFGTSGSGTLVANQSNLTTFTGNLQAFLVYQYGGPSFINRNVAASGDPAVPITFRGPQSMLAAHTGFNITSAQYTFFVTQMVVPALTSNGVPSGDVSSCFAPPLLDPTFISSIVGQ
jgi:hypothetical protein